MSRQREFLGKYGVYVGLSVTMLLGLPFIVIALLHPASCLV